MVNGGGNSGRTTLVKRYRSPRCRTLLYVMLIEISPWAWQKILKTMMIISASVFIENVKKYKNRAEKMTREISQYWPIKNSGSLLIVGFYGYSNMQILLFFKSCIRAYSVCWEQMDPYGSASHTCMAHHNILTGARCVNRCCMTVLSLDEIVWSILFDRRSGMGSRQYGDHWTWDYVGKIEVNIT